MFTGLIQARGVVEALAVESHGMRLTISFVPSEEPLTRGESVAVNGVCLTVLPFDGTFEAELSPETLLRTALSDLKPGDTVNLERALTLGSRLGGHLVQGHVDDVGVLTDVDRKGAFATFRWSFDPAHAALLVDKGSVTVDGVSLTVVSPDLTSFTAALIPETLANTNLGDCRPGARVNLEFDLMAKYAQKMLQPYLPVLPQQ